MKTELLPEVIASKFTICSDTGCWLWQGELNRNGYGRVWVSEAKKKLMAHRVIFEFLVGPIQQGLFLDHLCRRRNCCNPAHLEPVTPKDHTLRGNAILFKPLNQGANHASQPR